MTPFDCNMKLKLRQPHIEEIPYILESLKLLIKDNSILNEFEKFNNEELSSIAMNIVKTLLEERMTDTYKTKGVCCFSKTNDNLLMWSHYASSAKGFCLEFDCSNSDDFSRLFPVEYVEKPPEIDYKKAFDIDSLYFAKTLLCTKSLNWKYEKEWRLIHNEINKLYTYHSESLTGVYFGPEIDREFLEIICLIIQGQNPDVKFYQGTRATDLYKVNFEEITYRPYVFGNK